MTSEFESSGKAPKADQAELLNGRHQAELGHDPATRIRKHLYVANGQPLAKPHIDAYMEQLIRIKGRAHGLLDEQWTQLEGFFHGDPACLQTFIARTDEEMVATTNTRAHSLSRHEVDVTDAKHDSRVSTGIAPDGAKSKTANSSLFKSHKINTK